MVAEVGVGHGAVDVAFRQDLEALDDPGLVDAGDEGSVFLGVDDLALDDAVVLDGHVDLGEAEDREVGLAVLVVVGAVGVLEQVQRLGHELGVLGHERGNDAWYRR